MEAVLELNRQHLQHMTDTVAAAVTTNVERLIAAKEEDSTRIAEKKRRLETGSTIYYAHY